MDGEPLDPEVIGPILAPYSSCGPGIAIRVETADGRLIGSAGAPAEALAAGHESVHEIRASHAGGGARRVGGHVVGRVIGQGEGAIVDAIAASLAASLGALVTGSHVHAPADVASHRLEAELALGRRIQRSFVPLGSPAIPGYDIASHYEAATEVGGDFFDIFRLRTRSGRLAVVIADVTGKGIAAALLMAFARPLIRSAIDWARDPVEALARTNRILVEERRSALFITALCAIVDIRTGDLRLANAGHEPPLVVPADGGPIRWITGSGPLLGAFPTLDLVPCEVRIAVGDLVLLYTDGVTDARAASGERFGETRLLELVAATRGRSAQGVVDAIVEATREFQGAMPAADDVTIVALRRLEPGPGRVRRALRRG